MRRLCDERYETGATSAPRCEVRLLGGVQLLAAGHRVTLTPDARRLLGLLALRANRPVTLAQLSDLGRTPRAPSTGRRTAPGRRPADEGRTDQGRWSDPEQFDGPAAELAAAFVSCGLPGALGSRRGGYVLRLPGRQIDAAHFERLVARGTSRMAAGDLPGAARWFGTALRLWPTTPAADRLPPPAGLSPPAADPPPLDAAGTAWTDAAGRLSSAAPLAGIRLDPAGWAAGEADRLTRLRAEATADRWECELRRAAVAYRATGGPTASRRVVTAGLSAVEVAATARIELATAVSSEPTRARLWELLLVAAFLAAGRRAAEEVALRAGHVLRADEASRADAALSGAAATDHRLGELAEAARRGDLAEVWSRLTAADPGRPPDVATTDRRPHPVDHGSGRRPPAASSGPVPRRGAAGLGPAEPPAAAGTRQVGIHPAGGRRTPRRSAAKSAALPVPLTELIGRDALLIAVERLLAGRRLVTLTGPGGSGKTRLAIGVARRLAGAGACFVDLTAVDDDARVPEAVAAALGLPGQVDDTGLTELIGADLADDAVLLVLDNCEHVVDGCTALVARLLDRCPRLRVLATSRITLRLPMEALVPVPPLASAPVEPGHSLAELAQHPATWLFLDRARARCGHPVPPGSADAVARLCAELDGLPLAIELAAAWTPTLSVEEIATRTAADPLLLRSPDPTAPSRHRSLAAAVETSVTRLDDEARLLFEWLAVFPGGFDAEAAAAVRGPAGPDALAALVEASLVTTADDLEPAVAGPRRRSAEDRPPARIRYRMLTPIRRHALTRLTASGAETPARWAQARYALALAERANDLLNGAPAVAPPRAVTTVARLRGSGTDQPLRGAGTDPSARAASSDQVLRSLRFDLPNLRSAMRWLSGPAADGEEDLRLAVALATYWELDHRYREGLDWLVGASARHPAAPEPLRARAVTAAGRLARLVGGLEPASNARQRPGPPPNSRRPARPSHPATMPAERHPAKALAERHPAHGPVERHPAPEPAGPPARLSR